MAFICEICDFRHFPSAESFMAYLGLVLREHSSGEKRHQRSITKAGNSHLRRLLVESSWHYRYTAVPGKLLRSRQAGPGTGGHRLLGQGFAETSEKILTPDIQRENRPGGGNGCCPRIIGLYMGLDDRSYRLRIFISKRL